MKQQHNFLIHLKIKLKFQYRQGKIIYYLIEIFKQKQIIIKSMNQTKNQFAY